MSSFSGNYDGRRNSSSFSDRRRSSLSESSGPSSRYDSGGYSGSSGRYGSIGEYSGRSGYYPGDLSTRYASIGEYSVVSPRGLHCMRIDCMENYRGFESGDILKYPPRNCIDDGPDVYRSILGPTPDETILAGLQTVIEMCSVKDTARECPSHTNKPITNEDVMDWIENEYVMLDLSNAYSEVPEELIQQERMMLKDMRQLLKKKSQLDNQIKRNIGQQTSRTFHHSSTALTLSDDFEERPRKLSISDKVDADTIGSDVPQKSDADTQSTLYIDSKSTQSDDLRSTKSASTQSVVTGTADGKSESFGSAQTPARVSSIKSLKSDGSGGMRRSKSVSLNLENNAEIEAVRHSHHNQHSDEESAFAHQTQQTPEEEHDHHDDGEPHHNDHAEKHDSERSKTSVVSTPQSHHHDHGEENHHHYHSGEDSGHSRDSSPRSHHSHRHDHGEDDHHHNHSSIHSGYSRESSPHSHHSHHHDHGEDDHHHNHSSIHSGYSRESLPHSHHSHHHDHGRDDHHHRHSSVHSRHSHHHDHGGEHHHHYHTGQNSKTSGVSRPHSYHSLHHGHSGEHHHHHHSSKHSRHSGHSGHSGYSHHHYHGGHHHRSHSHHSLHHGHGHHHSGGHSRSRESTRHSHHDHHDHHHHGHHSSGGSSHSHHHHHHHHHNDAHPSHHSHEAPPKTHPPKSPSHEEIDKQSVRTGVSFSIKGSTNGHSVETIIHTYDPDKTHINALLKKPCCVIEKSICDKTCNIESHCTIKDCPEKSTILESSGAKTPTSESATKTIYKNLSIVSPLSTRFEIITEEVRQSRKSSPQPSKTTLVSVILRRVLSDTTLPTCSGSPPKTATPKTKSAISSALTQELVEDTSGGHTTTKKTKYSRRTTKRVTSTTVAASSSSSQLIETDCGFSDTRILETKYAIVRISSFVNFTTYEVLKSTRRRPRCLPCSIEGIFVTKNPC